MVRAPPELAQVLAAAPVRLSAPAEVTASVPLVAVERVRLAEVVVKEEAAPEAKVRAPAEELPIPTVPVEVPVLIVVLLLEEALMLAAAPVIVKPVEPVIKPSAVRAPLAWTTPAVEIVTPVEP